MGKLVKGLFGGTKSTTKPWKEQIPYIKQGFSDAQSIYNSQKGTPWYQGDLYATSDPLTKQGIGAIGDWVNGQGSTIANSLNATSKGLMGQSGNYIDAITKFNDLAGQDATAANIAAASKYADNPYVSGMIDAASRDINRNLTEGDLPSIDRAAVGSGNTNSSRAGVAEGIALRGAQDRIGDIASQIRGDAYSQGLNLAQQDRASQLGAAATSAGLYGDAMKTGFSGAQAGSNLMLNNLNAMIAAGQINQQDAQGLLDAAFTKWQGNDTRQSDLLNRYWEIVGKPLGQTTTQTQSPGVVGGLIGGLSAFKGLGGASGISSLFAASDVRVKRDIEKVGELWDGLGVYHYNYVWDRADEPIRTGVMAQEVEQLRPWALGPKVGDIMTVNYAAL